MERTERFYKIDQLLRAQKVVPLAAFLDALEISRATFKRDIEYMRSRFHAPIEWVRDAGGYRLDDRRRAGPQYELPGLWFSAAEIHALLTMEQLLASLSPGLLTPHVRPLLERLSSILDSGDHSADEVRHRIRILAMNARQPRPGHFEIVATAVLKRRQVRIVHNNRFRAEETTRVISPQRLAHYRDNWYVDAWCHLRNDVRSFSLDAILAATLLDDKAKSVADAELDKILASGYGIFGGAEVQRAKLRFTPERARWVARERWHPRQDGAFDGEGHYVLELPYSDDRELVGDILRHGAHVEVLGPPALRKRVAEALTAAARRYD
jgi:predicted DNA-binding transcriptional regulator YafY